MLPHTFLPGQEKEEVWGVGVGVQWRCGGTERKREVGGRCTTGRENGKPQKKEKFYFDSFENLGGLWWKCSDFGTEPQ